MTTRVLRVVAVRDRFGELFADAEFADSFAVTGPRGWSPGRLALVTVFQMAENLTDRQRWVGCFFGFGKVSALATRAWVGPSGVAGGCCCGREIDV
jgi:hypothetical protein